MRFQKAVDPLSPLARKSLRGGGLGVAPRTDRVDGIALFAGVAGLERAAHLVLGTRYRTLCYVERDAYAASALVARMEDAALGRAPIWDDVSTFDARRWRGLVDLVIGGFPCQDISDAGARRGILEGKRSSLWFEYARIVHESGARYVFAENVGALARRGLDVVLGTLADLGFDAEWLTLRASDVGAAHCRKRLFILAKRRDGLDDSLRGRHGDSVQEALPGRHTAVAAGHEMADALRLPSWERTGRERVLEVGANGDGALADAASERVGAEDASKAGISQPGTRESSGSRSGALADAERPGHEGHRPAEPSRRGEPLALHRDGPEIPLFAPGPGDREGWEELLASRPELAPAVKPRLRVLVDGVALVVDKGRTDQLRCAGNGVVDLQAAAALVVLDRRLGAGLTT